MKIATIFYFSVSICFFFNSCIYKTSETFSHNTDFKHAYDEAWVQPMIQATRAFNREQNLETATLLYEASEQMPVSDWENFFITASIFAQENHIDKAFVALEKALESGFVDIDFLITFPGLSPLHTDTRWAAYKEKVMRQKQQHDASIKNPEVLHILQSLWRKDQEALALYQQEIAQRGSQLTYEENERLFYPIEKQWDLNKKILDSIITIYGWPGDSLVGKEGSKLSWAIPQHYPDIFYKQKCLGYIKDAIAKEDTDPNYYAELSDRIARDTWQKQTYGASIGNGVLHPIKDSWEVDQRREALGIDFPVALNAVFHSVEYSVPSKSEALTIAKQSYNKAQALYIKFEEFIKTQKSDSARVSLHKAIDMHGDLSNKQLYDAAVSLAQLGDDRSKRLSIKILKVLIWRRWDDRAVVRNSNELKNLHATEDWTNLIELLFSSFP